MQASFTPANLTGLVGLVPLNLLSACWASPCRSPLAKRFLMLPFGEAGRRWTGVGALPCWDASLHSSIGSNFEGVDVKDVEAVAIAGGATRWLWRRSSRSCRSFSCDSLSLASHFCRASPK